MARGSARLVGEGGTQPLIRPEEYAQWPEVTEGDKAEVARVLDSGKLWGLGAPETTQLEEEVAAFCGTRHALLTNSGTAALHCALVGAGVEPVAPGEEPMEVITSALSFHATGQAILHAGAKPVFVDVDPVTYNISPEAVGKAITSRTRAVMPVHVHGLAADMDALVEEIGARRIALPGDAAQAPGATYRGHRVCSLGDGAGISGNGSKSLPGFEAGLYVVDDEEAHETARALCVFGEQTPRRGPGEVRPNYAEGVGFMYRGDEVRAAFMRSQLKRLPVYLAQARANARLIATLLHGVEGVTVAEAPEGYESDWYRLRVRVDAEALGWDGTAVELRDLLLHVANANGVRCSTWQTRPVPAEAVFRQPWPPKPWRPGREAVELEPWDRSRFEVTAGALDGTVCFGSLDVMLHNQSENLIIRWADGFARVIEALPRLRGLRFERVREVPEVPADVR